MARVLEPPNGLTSDAPFPPDCAARFTHVRLLGKGGFGAVYEAEQKDLGRRAAVKLML